MNYIDGVMKGSCALRLVPKALMDMNDVQLYKQIELKPMTDWKKSLEADGRPALNGELINLVCQSPATHRAIDNTVDCDNGKIYWKPEASCARKTCPKPQLAADVVFVDFKEKNLHTRHDADSTSEGKLKINVTAAFHRPKPTGKFEDKVWVYECGSDRTWTPSLGTDPKIDKERPSCPDVDYKPKKARSGPAKKLLDVSILSGT